jgi:hypothetical protein
MAGTGYRKRVDVASELASNLLLLFGFRCTPPADQRELCNRCWAGLAFMVLFQIAEESMSESRRLRRGWNEAELIVTIDMYFNGGMTDSHGHDDIARCIGRFNPNTASHNDGAVNQKLAEIMGYVERARRPRHAGERLVALVDRYRDKKSELHSAATAAWQSIVRDHDGPIPKYVREILTR